MILELEKSSPSWEKDPAVQAVVVRGAGDRAFCAGGDVPDLYRESREDPKRHPAARFLPRGIQPQPAHPPLPQALIALIDGIDMGGGVGVSVHGSHRVATEQLLFAMPETTIGLFPDVGGGYFLTRLPGALGTYLALTGHRVKAADAL